MEKLDLLDPMEKPDLQVIQDLLGPKEKLVILDQLVILGPKEKLVQLVTQVQLAILVIRELPELQLL
uniref:Uncharacterized protein n=1 Tax=viral metagenome TaxID=1070528 RepID=A0A6C0JGL2_9ZZZZ